MQEIPEGYRMTEQDYQSTGRFPIIDQGQQFISGFCNNPEHLYQGPLPVIIFGDHTRIFKYVDFPFVCGADGTRVLLPNAEKFDPLFLFFTYLNLKIPNRGYNRHFGILREHKIPLPEQREIARILKSVDERIEAEEKKKTALEALFRTLLHHLMTAKVRVKSLIPEEGG